jgi:hypothetical protein
MDPLVKIIEQIRNLFIEINSQNKLSKSIEI